MNAATDLTLAIKDCDTAYPSTYPLLRLRQTGTGTVRLEMGAVIHGSLQWQPVPIVMFSDLQDATL